ncbi:MAG: chemotaxis protein [Bacteroidota bacterium]|nr:chemotaxis protein [Candidatus Kapabacteria bacterium]MDW8221218.1 chemotaxis protein [Bacteroidota bacterium]
MAKQTSILLESGTNELEVIEFVIDYPDSNGTTVSQSFGINVAKVREIIKMPQITALPNMPPSTVGIFNLRGYIVPVIDLGNWLYHFDNVTPDRKLIVAEFNAMRLGFVVNDVRRIYRFSWKQVEAPDALTDFGADNTSIIGIIKTEDKNILMVDVEKIIAEINPKLGLEEVETIEHFEGGKYTILMVEDSPTIRKMIQDRLRVASYNVLSCRDGLAAWEMLLTFAERAQKGEDLRKMVNLVITDIEMPQLDGHALTKNIKNHPVLSSLPVIIFSSLVSEDLYHKGEAVGADAQLTKPKISLLLDTVWDLLKKYNQLY